MTRHEEPRAWPESAVNLAAKISAIDAPWTPHVVGALNGQLVKLARLEGEFVWHAHAGEDELFLVLRGVLIMRLREPGPGGATAERAQTVREGEFLIVPRGVEHLPVAEPECVVLLFEPASTAHAGDADTPRAIPVDRQPRL